MRHPVESAATSTARRWAIGVIEQAALFVMFLAGCRIVIVVAANVFRV